MGIAIEVSIADKDVMRMLKRLGEKAADLSKPMKLIGEMMRGSVDENFKRGGRPRWIKSERAKRESGQTLIDTRRLQDSISSEAFRNHVRIGSNVAYAAIHQLGGKIQKTVAVRSHQRKSRTVRAHSRKMNTTIIARPYLVVQREDKKEINRIIKKHLVSLR